jgi:hypothetical protein
LVLEPVIACYRERELGLYFCRCARFTKPAVKELLEANQVLPRRIGHLALAALPAAQERRIVGPRREHPGESRGKTDRPRWTNPLPSG